MVIITAKKNRVMYGGKTFHVTPTGRHLPLGAKQNWFTKCMSDGLKGNLNTGENLSKAKLKANKTKFREVLDSCIGTPKPKPRTRAPAK